LSRKRSCIIETTRFIFKIVLSVVRIILCIIQWPFLSFRNKILRTWLMLYENMKYIVSCTFLTYVCKPNDNVFPPIFRSNAVNWSDGLRFRISVTNLRVNARREYYFRFINRSELCETDITKRSGKRIKWNESFVVR